MPSIASPQAGPRFVWTTFWTSGAFWTRAKWPGKERGVCKDNIAAYVSITLPHLRRQPLTSVCCDASGLTCYAAYLCVYQGKAPIHPILRFRLTPINMRHNITYIFRAGWSDGQTDKNQSENAGAQTDGHLEPSPRLGVRH